VEFSILDSFAERACMKLNVGDMMDVQCTWS